MRLTFTDLKQPIDAMDLSLGYSLDLQTVSNYYPFGMQMPGMSWTKDSKGYRYGFQGQEKDNEIYGEGNMTTAEFWQYDTRLGRRWNLDPRPVGGMSPYLAFQNNPIIYSDHKGDTTFVSNTGDVLNKQTDRDGDLLDSYISLSNDDGTSELIGELGQGVNIDKILPNLLDEHQSEATELGILDWKDRVKPNGEWDLKNTRESERPGETETVFGLAWEYDHTSGNSKKGNFTPFQSNSLFFNNAADIGNYHAGYTGTYVWGGFGIPKAMQVIGAGFFEQKKNEDFDWKSELNPFNMYSPTLYWYTHGDRPADYKWNTRGMLDAESEKNSKKLLSPDSGFIIK